MEEKKEIGQQSSMVITPKPQQVIDITSIGTMGPFPKTEEGNVYAVTIQCELTKFVRIIPKH